ncbi:uncharacterized protein LOC116432992 [Nomia melanderi]|uniref:uncharacterized protein LOC116432992 n=1 Tax=Nomia melanderi TaxID=2448451 RepID=UPI0013043F59|nr:uncharacterized protein LOC116432992 [Nomia melanderi]XP_031846415.1 uncharacterized protein LOC116432992 [Nomia melanderi]XP_031846416.1 uncharacterized protein LOC116432992 [Nomia melanderi]XP_031846417.1 uncharacterized protein LOC116432992 [Nomia melanderi]XP_031846418.1 uncharacterized protein LOC116432992 [Nomia melanderi]XP_031846419.1 uncharacterized protein LOC116432992 [Nomia melanderi]
MRRGSVLSFLWITSVLRITAVLGDADPAIPTAPDLTHFQQSRPSSDPRPRLSASQQAQILSDVQQHQQRYRRPQQDLASSYSSLSKYKVDRSKQQQQQQQIQQLLRQQQQVQQLIQQQQLKIAQQLNSANYLSNAGRSQPRFESPKQLQPEFSSQYQDGKRFETVRQDLSQPLFSDQQTVQFQEYLEKQRDLEQLEKQRQQLLLEQQEVRKQQELLRLDQLRKLADATSTTTAAPTAAPTAILSTAFPSSTASSVLVSLPTARKITPSETELFLKAIQTHQKKYSIAATSTTPIVSTTRQVSTTRPTTRVSSSAIPENLLSLIQEQEARLAEQGKPKPRIKVVYQTERPVDREEKNPKTLSGPPGSDKDALLKQLKLALAKSVDDDARNVSTRDIVLPDGKKIQVIDDVSALSTLPAPLLTTTTTVKPPKAILEELTKGVLPPGADFEVIRQKSDGKLEEIGKAPIQSLPAKKVTFVVLEEQPDGSYKVQGVKGNADKEGDVDSIVERIKKGELKLPPSSANLTKVAARQQTGPVRSTVSTTFRPTTVGGSTVSSVHSDRSVEYSPVRSTVSTTYRPSTVAGLSSVSLVQSDRSVEYSPQVTVSPNSVSTGDKYLSSASSVTGHVFNSLNPIETTLSTPRSLSTAADQDGRVTGNTAKYPTVTRSHFIPTMAPVNEIITTTPGPVQTFPHRSTASYVHFTVRPSSETPPTARPISTTGRPATTLHNENNVYQEGFERSTLSSPTEYPAANSRPQEGLATLLKREGLFAMTKYLRQSGLDSVLNETGPYTLFVPTDKAFRTLLVQLGGPEKAEQKFRDNPRLLSGLLLHHVIPGAFRIDTLQDEMTGVSLAGTQLRVNEYATHDHEWNDVKLTTINGAKVAPNKRDIEIPQGVAHAVDRVMFPLPVGDLVQTLQADRERRFTTFLKMLYVSGLQDTLSGPKSFTIFAPTDSAFDATQSKDGAPIWSEEDGPEAAKTIISRHILPSTLYTAGMRYYLQKDTLRPQSPVHIHKNGGRVRVNEAHVVTHNVPATNGVIHAIDGVL